MEVLNKFSPKQLKRHGAGLECIFKQVCAVLDTACAMVLAGAQLGGFICAAGQQEHQAGLSSCHAVLCQGGGESEEPELEVAQ